MRSRAAPPSKSSLARLAIKASSGPPPPPPPPSPPPVGFRVQGLVFGVGVWCLVLGFGARLGEEG